MKKGIADLEYESSFMKISKLKLKSTFEDLHNWYSYLDSATPYFLNQNS